MKTLCSLLASLIVAGGAFAQQAEAYESHALDNIWMVDMLLNESDSQATLLVGNAGYHMCRSAMELEARRIEGKFGLDVTELSRY